MRCSSRGLADEAAKLRERERLIPDRSPTLLLECAQVFGELVANHGLARMGPPSPTELATGQRIGDEAIDLVQEAVACGFRDLGALRRNAAVQVLASDSRVRDALADAAFPENVFASEPGYPTASHP